MGESHASADSTGERAPRLPLGKAHPMLAVADLDAAIEHYRTVLGFFVEWVGHGEATGRGIANLWRGSLSLFVMTDERFGPACVYCHLEGRADVDALHADLVSTGASVTAAPADRAWGLYEMRVVDLDGNEIRFASFLDAEGRGA